jgi:hypothetical protein
MSFKEEQQVHVGAGVITVSDNDWLIAHASHDGSGWVCKSTGRPILYVAAWHEVSGIGLVNVFHLYCPECSSGFTPPDPSMSHFKADELIVVCPCMKNKSLCEVARI